MVDGVVIGVDNIAKELCDRCNVTVFTVAPANKNKTDTLPHPYNVVRCKSKSIFFLDYDLPTPGQDKAFQKTLNESNLDLVYFHSPMCLAKYAIKYAKKHNIPILSHMHSQYREDFYRATKSKLLSKLLLNRIMKYYNQSDCAIAVNEFTQNLFTKEYGLTAPSKVIYNGTYMTPLENLATAKNEINAKYNLEENEKILLFVGRINKLKNIDFTLKALTILKEKYTNFKYLIVGSGKDTAYFQKRVNKLNLNQNVLFLGKITDGEDLKKIYARADLFLFPSKYDTDGVVKIEAAAQGTPSVLLSNTGASSAIKHNQTGYISNHTPEEYANTIYEALTNTEQYKQICENIKTDLYRTWQQPANEVYALMLSELAKKNKHTN